jgi:hypothetical protein
MTDYPIVSSVSPLDGYKLNLIFDDGTKRVFDVSVFFEFPAFQPLRDKAFFDTVFLERGRPMWGDKTLDISPNMLRDDFTPSGFVKT